MEDRMDSQAPVIATRALTKAYGKVEALRGVDITIYKSEVHAVVGDNGAGKSTLLKILSGAVSPSSGDMLLDGQAVQFESPQDARDRGIETVYQDLALAGDRSCAANIYLGREILKPGPLGKLGILDRPRMNENAKRFFADLSIPITDPTRNVRAFSGGQRQGVAIARAAIWATHVVLLDEPTAALGVRQREAVASLIERLKARGLAVVLVTHDIPEVLKIADRVTVLRLGRAVATRDCKDINIPWIVATMVGHDVQEQRQ
jgi:simple sugar transport system ATP-binding protein